QRHPSQTEFLSRGAEPFVGCRAQAEAGFSRWSSRAPIRQSGTSQTGLVVGPDAWADLPVCVARKEIRKCGDCRGRRASAEGLKQNRSRSAVGCTVFGSDSLSVISHDQPLTTLTFRARTAHATYYLHVFFLKTKTQRWRSWSRILRQSPKGASVMLSRNGGIVSAGRGDWSGGRKG